MTEPSHGFWQPGRVVLFLALLAVGNLAIAVVILYAIHGPGGSGTMMDFGALWAAGRMALDGRAVAAYDPAAIAVVQEAALGTEYGREMAWLYPPILQLALIPFGSVPMLMGQAIWTSLTLAAYLAVARAIWPGWAGMVAAMAPGTVVLLLVNGQTGFLTAALAGVALLGFCNARAASGGLALGLLAIKPQVAPLLPLPFLVAGPRVAVAWACGGVLILAVLATLVFGIGIWGAFLNGLTIGSRDLVREDVLSIQATARAALVSLGAAPGVGWVVQGVVAAVAVLALVHGLRRWPRASVAAAVLYTGMAASPRVMDYDLTLLLIGALFQARRISAAGGPGLEKFAMLVAVLLPLADLLMRLPLNWLVAPLLLAGLMLGEAARTQSGSATGPRSG
ncbi:MAG: glycosyltransferase family 87 protein [Pseudomonadota bacterium]